MTVGITGMALNTALGDRPEVVLNRMMAGDSGIGPWRSFPPPPHAAVIGGELNGYNISAKIKQLQTQLPADVGRRLQKMMPRLPWSMQLTLLAAADAALQANWWGSPVHPEEIAVLVAGHNFNLRYAFENYKKFQKEPDYIDALLAVHMLDTTHAACVSELLGSKGSIGTVGASCASGNLGLRAALDELADGASMVMLVAPIYDYAPSTLHSLGLMGATTEAPVEQAATASRPFDRDRAGFVPSHGVAAVVLEPRVHAARRGVRVLAELLAAEAGSDACHRPPKPAPAEQAALIRSVLAAGGVEPHELGLVSAHAASTPAGDLAEARALSVALAGMPVAINAPKSMLGHCGWASALVETVIAVEELQRGEVHGTINAENPEVELVTAGPREIRSVLNNAFGFGGLGCVSLLGKGE